MKRQLQLAVLLAVGGTVLVAACVWKWELATFAVRWLDVGQAARPVDYVVALPGDDNRRPFVAAALVRAGLAGRAIIVQVADSPDVEEGIKLPAAETVRRIYEFRGIPQSQIILLEGQSDSTADDLAILAEFLADHPNASLAVVTSAFHTRRAAWTIRRRMGAATDRIIIVSAPNPDFDDHYWWDTEAGFSRVISEYLKLLAYWFRYGSGVWWTVCIALTIIALCRYKLKGRRQKKLLLAQVEFGSD